MLAGVSVQRLRHALDTGPPKSSTGFLAIAEPHGDEPMYSIELKIKRLTLAAEARLIRTEEKRAKAKLKIELLDSLHCHRDGVVRRAARAAHLAHAFLTGRAYATVETRTKDRPWEADIAENLRRFGGREFMAMEKKALNKLVGAWLDGGAPVSSEASNPSLAGATPAAAA